MLKTTFVFGLLGLLILSPLGFSGGDPVRLAWEGLPTSTDGCGGTSTIGAEPRTVLCHLLSTLSLATLGKLAAVPVFLSGPHKDAPNFFANKDFGHYNPAFLNWAIDKAIPAASDPAFRTATQSVYDRYLKYGVLQHLATLYRIRVRAEEFATLKKFYADKIASAEGVSYIYILNDAVNYPATRRTMEPGESRRPEPSRPPKMTDFAALSFWLRRSMDGTFDQAQRGLEKVAVLYSKVELEKLRSDVANELHPQVAIVDAPKPVAPKTVQAAPPPPAPAAAPAAKRVVPQIRFKNPFKK